MPHPDIVQCRLQDGGVGAPQTARADTAEVIGRGACCQVTSNKMPDALRVITITKGNTMPFLQQVAQRYHQITQWFIPVCLNETGTMRRNAENTVFLGLLAGLSVPIFALLYHYLEFDTAAVIVLCGGAAMICTPLVVKATARVAWGREYFIGSFYVMKMFLAYYLGGIAAPTLPWLLLCPMVAMALGSVRSCAQWGIIIAVTVTGMFYLQTRGVVVFPAIPFTDQRLLQVVSILGLFIFSAILLLFLKPGPSAGSGLESGPDGQPVRARATP